MTLPSRGATVAPLSTTPAVVTCAKRMLRAVVLPLLLVVVASQITTKRLPSNETTGYLGDSSVIGFWVTCVCSAIGIGVVSIGTPSVPTRTARIPDGERRLCQATR